MKRNPGRKQQLLFMVFLLFVFAVAAAASPIVENKRTDSPYILQRISGKITLDGLSKEAAWNGITPLPMIMHTPTFGKEPSEKTVVLIGYDDKYLYVAGRMYESDPSGIKGYSRKRDDLGAGNDWFGIVLDTFNDNENALAFFTIPTGIRTDMAVFDDAEGDFPINIHWNTYWDVKTVRNSQGWFVEMKIPFSSLRFQEKNGQVVMGLTCWRWIARKFETVIFPAISPEGGDWVVFKPSQTKKILLKGIKSRKTTYIAPYILGGFNHNADLEGGSYRTEKERALEAGLDLKYAFSSNLTMDLTINTDFAQVEADDEQVNLTRFSLFFPEKRLFFQERSGIFNFSLGGPNRLFHSRRIGLYEDQPIPLLGGVRMVGRLGGWDVGVMSMQTARAVVEVDDVEETVPSQNFTVMRLRRRIINDYSYVGALLTSKIGTDGSYNIAYGLDGIFRVKDDNYLILKWAQSFEKDAENQLLSLKPSLVDIFWERRNVKGWFYNGGVSFSGCDFNPEMGFQDRENYTRYGANIGYGWIPGETSKFVSYSFAFDGSIFLSNDSHRIETMQLLTRYHFQSKSGLFGSISLGVHHEEIDEAFSFNEESDDEETDHDIPLGIYDFYGLEGVLTTPVLGNTLWETFFYIGTFYDGWMAAIGINPLWHVSPGLEISGSYQYNRIRFPDRHKQIDAHILRVRAIAMFNTKLSISSFVQYNSITDTLGANLRLRYNPAEGIDLYLVYNEGINFNRFRELPHLPKTDNRTIMLKYTYTFKL